MKINHDLFLQINILICFDVNDFLKMPKNPQIHNTSSKKAEEAIHKFQYYVSVVFPDIFTSSFPSDPSTSSFDSVKGPNDILYFYAQRSLEDNVVFTPKAILETARKVYLHQSDHHEIRKINNNSYQKKTQLKRSTWGLSKIKINQIMTFCLSSCLEESTKAPKKSVDQQLWEQLYVVHFCNQERKSDFVSWLSFVQKYTFTQKGIKYQLTGSIKKENAIFWKNNNSSLFQQILLYHSNQEQFDKIHGILLQHQNDIKLQLKKSNDPAYSQEHLLIRKIPPQYLKIVHQLKKDFSQEKQNLICRYLIARDFNYQESKRQIQDFINWRDDLNRKFKWEDFEDFHRRQIFMYLGQDFMGRPVILNRSCHILVNELDLEMYCLYYMYFLQIFLETKMRGNVSQTLVIVDAAGTNSDHFKFAVTKRNISDCLKYGPERQYKLFAINVGTFVNYTWKLIKPLLPKRTHEKMIISGNTHEQNLQCFKEEMDVSVIPTYLGGKNPIC